MFSGFKGLVNCLQYLPLYLLLLLGSLPCGAINMTDEEKKKAYSAALEKASKATEQFTGQLYGTHKFKDSGRQSSGMAEAADSVVGVPVRTAIDELQKGNWNWNTAKKIAESIGKDPKNAPDSVDLAARATDNPVLGAGIATAIDLAGLPLPGLTPGVKGSVKVKDAAKGLLKGSAPAVERVSNQQLGKLDTAKASGLVPDNAVKVSGNAALESAKKKLASGPVEIPKTANGRLLEQWLAKAKEMP